MQTNYYLITNNKVVTKTKNKIELQNLVYNDPTLCDSPMVFKSELEANQFASKHNYKNTKVISITSEEDVD